MIPSLNSIPKASIILEKNVWADFVELSCLMSTDKEISLSDMLLIVSGEGHDSPERGSDGTGEQDDAFYQEFLDIFKYLENRADILDNAYPFSFIDGDTITIDLGNLESRHLLYLFLLYSSNLSFFTKSEQQRLTKAFESISRYILKQIYPAYHVEVFGTANNPGDIFHGGKLIDRFEKLAQCLHTEVKPATKKNPRYNRAGGDGGLDLVGFIQLDKPNTETPFIPACFAQCACSVEKWKEKQSSIKYDEWNQRFEQLAHYCEFIFVPFSLRGPDGKWSDEEADRMAVIPVDRIRFLHIGTTKGECLTFFETNDAYKTVQESINYLQ